MTDTDGLSHSEPDAEKKRVHPAWKVFATRLVAALVLILLSVFIEGSGKPLQVGSLLLFYLLALALITGLARAAIDQKRVRIGVSILDIFAISFLVRLTGADESLWLLPFVFPVISISRRLGRRPSVIAAAIAVAAGYGLAGVPWPMTRAHMVSVGYLAAVLSGVALTANNLGRSRQWVERRIGKTIDEIYRQLLHNHKLQNVMDLILGTALTLTRSDMSAIALVDGGEISGFFAATDPLAKSVSIEDARRILDRHYRQALDSTLPLSLVKSPKLARFLGKRAVAEPPWAGRLIPLTIGGASFGVLGVFSMSTVHYTPDDLQKLSGLTPLIAIAQQNAKLLQELASRDEERKAHLAKLDRIATVSKGRLDLLYDIGEQLRTDQGLARLFQNVVDLVAQRVGSEEAALFLKDDREQRLNKVSVAGPDPATAAELRSVELDEKPLSLTWKVFEEEVLGLNNDIDTDEPHVGVYARKLPSRVTKHFMGAPLRIGDEVLGVIRVLNKKGIDYAPETESASLDDTGFVAADFSLLRAIATYVASAIRNAMFIEKNRHFEFVVYRSPDPIIVIDRDGNIQMFNQECEKIWGFPEREAKGRPVETLYESPEHAREIGRALWQADDHTIRAYPARVRSGETVIPIRLSANLLFDPSGELVSSIGVFNDEREMIEAEKRRTRDAKLDALGRLAQTTGHDIKHDIGAILNFVNVLQRGGGSDDPFMQDMYEGIRAAATGALGKVQNMLMTANPKMPDKQVVSLKSVIDTFSEGIEYRAAATGVVFEKRYPDDDPAILADAEQLRQVLANLFGNSLDAINLARAKLQSAGRIVLSLTVDQEVARLSWCDDAGGMSEEARANLFTAFYTTKTTGSGLGLYITRRIIEHHGGEISVRPYGEGDTCFEIVLPLYAEPQVPLSDEEGAP